MKIRCPGCDKQYPAPALAPGKRVTVRCRACGSLFRLEASPSSPAPAAASPAGAEQTPKPSPAPSPPPAEVEPVFSVRDGSEPAGASPAAASPAAAEQTPEPSPEPSPAPPSPAPSPAPGASVLIADEGRPFRDRLLQAVRQLGWSCALVEDGESALGYMREHRPRLLLVNVYLRKLLGISVCERVKADPQLQATKVILIGALFRQDRFVRRPEHLYGADGYIEEAIEPAELRQRLAALMGADGAASAAAPADDAATPSPPSDTGAPPPPEDLLRLIRIILSDIVVYNQERVEAALQSGQFTQEFKEELEEGRRLLLGRFPGLPCVEQIYWQGVERWVEERRRVPAS